MHKRSASTNRWQANMTRLYNNVIIGSAIGFSFKKPVIPQHTSLFNNVVVAATKVPFSAQGISSYNPAGNLVITNVAAAGFFDADNHNWLLKNDSIVFKVCQGFKRLLPLSSRETTPLLRASKSLNMRSCLDSSAKGAD